jgi:hypothetical protein
MIGRWLIGFLLAAMASAGILMSISTGGMIEDLRRLNGEPKIIIRKIDTSVLDLGEEAALLEALAQVTNAGTEAVRRHAVCEVQRSRADGR